VEWYIDTRQDGGKPTLQLDVSFSFLLTLCFLIARLGRDNITERLLHLLRVDGVWSALYRHIKLKFHQEPCIYLTYLSDVDLLNLEEVQDIGHGLQRQKLSCANILLTLNKQSEFECNSKRS